MTTIRIKLPTIEQVTFSLEAEQEDLPVRGYCIASGDEKLDKKVEDEIIRRLDNGDVWAWATVTVTAQWKGLEGLAYLGGCSYASEDDFKKESLYFDSMKSEAYENLIEQIKALKNTPTTSNKIETVVKFTITTPYGNRLPVTTQGFIGSQNGNNFSGDWLLKGIRNVRSSEFIPFSQITPDRIKSLQLLYKNGNPRYTGVDIDHGSQREWQNTKYHGIQSISFE